MRQFFARLHYWWRFFHGDPRPVPSSPRTPSVVVDPIEYYPESNVPVDRHFLFGGGTARGGLPSYQTPRTVMKGPEKYVIELRGTDEIKTALNWSEARQDKTISELFKELRDLSLKIEKRVKRE